MLLAGLNIAVLVFSCIFFLASVVTVWTKYDTYVEVCKGFTSDKYATTCGSANLDALGPLGEWIMHNVTDGYDDYGNPIYGEEQVEEYYYFPDVIGAYEQCYAWDQCNAIRYSYVISAISICIQLLLVAAASLMVHDMNKLKLATAGTPFSPWVSGMDAYALAAQDVTSVYNSAGGRGGGLAPLRVSVESAAADVTEDDVRLEEGLGHATPIAAAKPAVKIVSRDGTVSGGGSGRKRTVPAAAAAEESESDAAVAVPAKKSSPAKVSASSLSDDRQKSASSSAKKLAPLKPAAAAAAASISSQRPAAAKAASATASVEAHAAAPSATASGGSNDSGASPVRPSPPKSQRRLAQGAPTAGAITTAAVAGALAAPPLSAGAVANPIAAAAATPPSRPRPQAQSQQAQAGQQLGATLAYYNNNNSASEAASASGGGSGAAGSGAKRKGGKEGGAVV